MVGQRVHAPWLCHQPPRAATRACPAPTPAHHRRISGPPGSRQMEGRDAVCAETSSSVRLWWEFKELKGPKGERECRKALRGLSQGSPVRMGIVLGAILEPPGLPRAATQACQMAPRTVQPPPLLMREIIIEYMSSVRKLKAFREGSK